MKSPETEQEKFYREANETRQQGKENSQSFNSCLTVACAGFLICCILIWLFVMFSSMPLRATLVALVLIAVVVVVSRKLISVL